MALPGFEVRHSSMPHRGDPDMPLIQGHLAKEKMEYSSYILKSSPTSSIVTMSLWKHWYLKIYSHPNASNRKRPEELGFPSLYRHLLAKILLFLPSTFATSNTRELYSTTYTWRNVVFVTKIEALLSLNDKIWMLRNYVWFKIKENWMSSCYGCNKISHKGQAYNAWVVARKLWGNSSFIICRRRNLTCMSHIMMMPSMCRNDVHNNKTRIKKPSKSRIREFQSMIERQLYSA